MTVYGYAWIARGRDDGTSILQNQWMRFTGAGNDDANILEDIITGTVMQRPGLEWSAGGYPGRRLPGGDQRWTGWDATPWVPWS